jgi:hypothetical protein
MRLLTALALASALLAADKPDFTGEWKLNKSKSDLGPMADRMPDTVIVKIDHKEPEIKLSQPGMRGNTMETRMTTDGKASKSSAEGPMGPMTSTSSAKWAGESLEVKTTRSMGGNEMTQSDKWTLSADGKVLTIERQMETPMGQMQMKQVLEKQ